ncbi:MAG: penicillin-binding protein 1C [Candidatus Cloacimonetes bacterium]|nr:penicillin-binding protein 1C [Candidatus Cloacimonadota bacterium]
MKKIIILFMLIMPILFLGIYLLFPLKPLFSPEKYGTVIFAENGEILHSFLNKNEQWCFPPDTTIVIPRKLKLAVLTFEDKHFYSHFGVNPLALFRGLYLNIRYRKIMSGGSTITMQLARISNPKARTYWYKFREILLAIKIETRFSKDEILQMYLDNAPYGGNIIGFQAASFKYFRKKPEQLSWGEAATLAILPNSPAIISPGKNQEKLIAKRNKLLKMLFEKNVIDAETFTLSVREPTPKKIYIIEQKANHIARSLHNKYRGKSVKSTINNEIQKKTEKIIKQYNVLQKMQGVNNAAAIIVETKTGKIRGYIGSQNFWDNEFGGQVDGVKASRSSGSILKPFLYALCIEDGIILPQTLIKDVPTYFGSFSPENADHKFEGLITAENALIYSKNIPAVRLLNTYGIADFYNFLQSAGVSTLFRNAGDYGLSLIIGGAETNLYDLAMLYRGLANYGKFSALKIIESDIEKQFKQPILSPGACYLTLDILKKLKRPGDEFYWHQYENQYHLSWKTGTSFGNRDAWAVGVSPDWTIAVWVGNFTGEGNPAIGGARSAGPILFDIYNSLPKTAKWFEIPSEEMNYIGICKETGFLAGVNCSDTLWVLSPNINKTVKKCPYHQKIFVSETDENEVCSMCWDADSYKSKNVSIYPPHITQYLHECGHNISKLPPHNEKCTTHPHHNFIEITYPIENSCLWIPRDIGGKLQKITVKLVHQKKKSTVFWYLDDIYLGTSTTKHSKAITFSEGNHILEVIDKNGNRCIRKFKVRLKK